MTLEFTQQRLPKLEAFITFVLSNQKCKEIMENNAEYTVVVSDDTDGLIKIVNKRVRDGYKPVGGIFIAKTVDSGGKEWYYQSMFKEE